MQSEDCEFNNTKTNGLQKSKIRTENPNLQHLKRLLQLISLTLFYSLIVHLKNIYYLIFGKPRKDISGQLAVITGGGGGLGRALALELAKNGCNIAIVDIDLKAAEFVANEVQKENVKTKAYKVDVTKYAEVEKLADDIENDLGYVDILVNNAGLLTRGLFLNTSPEVIENTVSVNLLSYILTVRVFLPRMIKRGKGHIVAINSVAGVMGVPLGTIYSATKFGITGFMKSITYELACKNQEFIKTTTIHPYFMSTRKDLMDFLNENEYLYYLPSYAPESAAKHCVSGILEEDRLVFIPGAFKQLSFFKGWMPYEADIFFSKLMLRKNF